MLRIRVTMLMGLCLAGVANAAPVGSFADQVVAALNVARSDPKALNADLAAYRARFRANLVSLSDGEDLETSEGVRPVDEAIGFVAAHAPAGTLRSSVTLAEAAADHVGEQQSSGEIGHAGSGGLSPSDRVMRRGGGPLVAELIAYGARDATEVVRQLIVDDGVADRDHRRILFAPHLRYVGVACGPHPVFDTMCVIDLAETADGREANARALDVAAR